MTRINEYRRNSKSTKNSWKNILSFLAQYLLYLLFSPIANPQQWKCKNPPIAKEILRWKRIPCSTLIVPRPTVTDHFHLFRLKKLKQIQKSVLAKIYSLNHSLPSTVLWKACPCSTLIVPRPTVTTHFHLLGTERD